MGIPMQHTLIEIGHPQLPTPIQIDNTTAVGIATDSIKQKYCKALEMRWYWLKDQIHLKHVDVFSNQARKIKLIILQKITHLLITDKSDLSFYIKQM